MSEVELKAIEARAWRDAEVDALRCIHGREPYDRCETCSGDDVQALVAEVRRTTQRLERLAAKQIAQGDNDCMCNVCLELRGQRQTDGDSR